MDEKLKVCPMCAEEIPIDAELCGYCGAKFEVINQGYCRICHNMRKADGYGKCVVCGETLTDWHIDSHLLVEHKPETAQVEPPPDLIKEDKYTLQIHPIKGETVFTRFGAFFVDQILIAVLFLLVTLMLIILAVGVEDLFEPKIYEDLFYTTYFLSIPLIWFLYFFIFEGALGTTPGKALDKLVVIRKGGGRPNWGQAAIRAFFSLFENNLIGAIVIWTTKQNQRIGDLVAGTLVVNKKKLFLVEMAPPGLNLIYHDYRNVTYNRLISGTIGRLGAYRELLLIGQGKDDQTLETKIESQYLRSLFDMLCQNLQERYHLVFTTKVLIKRLVLSIISILVFLLLSIGAFLMATGRLDLMGGAQPIPENPQAFEPTSGISATPTFTITPVPSPTQRPTATATPLPIEANFDTLADFEDGQLISFIGRLALMGSTLCDYKCGLLLENPSNTTQTVILFVVVGDEPNQMKALSDNYTKGDIRVRLDDGSYAYVGYRLNVTGRKCTTDQGNPCISSIQKIDLYQVP